MVGRAHTSFEDYVEAEGGVGIHIYPPATIVLDTIGLIVAVRGWYGGYGITFCNGGGACQSNWIKELRRCHQSATS